MTSFFDHNQVKVNKEFFRESARQAHYTLEDFLQDKVPHSLIEQRIFDEAYIGRLYQLLKVESIYDLAKEVLEVEKVLEKLADHLPVDIQIPSLNVFYHQLGPVFIQLFVEVESIKEHEKLEAEWLKAVRIALEEEIIVWQEKSLK